jgi:hypothetical protein
MFDGPLLGTLGSQVEEPAEHLQVLPTGEDLVGRSVLAGEADAPPNSKWLADHVEPADQGEAAVRPDQRGEDPDGGRLAGTVGTSRP